MNGSAVFSADGKYRYWLTRYWELGPTLSVIMLNPSTANADVLDPTVRRVVGFAEQWGYGSLIVVNLFALRSTNPKRLKQVDDPSGPHNIHYIKRACDRADGPVLCAWGSHGKLHDRGWWMQRNLQDWGVEADCLGFTKGAEPVHPLYQRLDTQRIDLETGKTRPRK